MSTPISPKHRTWAEIDLNAIYHNYKVIRDIMPQEEKFIAVIKANAYGHGDLAVAALLDGKADYFMVAEIGEALRLRQNKIQTPILIAGYTDPEYAPILCENNLTQCVFSLPYAKQLHEMVPPGKQLKCHIKLDSGMGRLGFSLTGDTLRSEFSALLSLSSLIWEGVFSHFAQSEIEDTSYTCTQQSAFRRALVILEEVGITPQYCHLNNSAASLLSLKTHTNTSRVGLSLYGCYPSRYVKHQWEQVLKRPALQQAMKLKTRVVSVHRLSPGESVGYNRRFIASAPSTIAVLAAGYADGLPRALSQSTGAPTIAEGIHFVGSVCMDMSFADVSGSAKQYHEGDEVTLFGEGIGADAWAEHMDTISYEIFCNLSSRVPRIYNETKKL